MLYLLREGLYTKLYMSQVIGILPFVYSQLSFFIRICELGLSSTKPRFVSRIAPSIENDTSESHWLLQVEINKLTLLGPILEPL